MGLFSLLVGSFVPVAHAALEQIGAGSPGIDAMWSDIKSFFPHTDEGANGIAFITLLLTNFILRFIAGIAVLMIVYAGIRMIMTVGDENAHAESKKIILYACLGLIFTITADAIVMYVMNVVQLATGG